MKERGSRLVPLAQDDVVNGSCHQDTNVASDNIADSDQNIFTCTNKGEESIRTYSMVNDIDTDPNGGKYLKSISGYVKPKPLSPGLFTFLRC